MRSIDIILKKQIFKQPTQGWTHTLALQNSVKNGGNRIINFKITCYIWIYVKQIFIFTDLAVSAFIHYFWNIGIKFLKLGILRFLIICISNFNTWIIIEEINSVNKNILRKRSIKQPIYIIRKRNIIFNLTLVIKNGVAKLFISFDWRFVKRRIVSVGSYFKFNIIFRRFIVTVFIYTFITASCKKWTHKSRT